MSHMGIVRAFGQVASHLASHLPAGEGYGAGVSVGVPVSVVVLVGTLVAVGVAYSSTVGSAPGVGVGGEVGVGETAGKRAIAAAVRCWASHSSNFLLRASCSCTSVLSTVRLFTLAESLGGVESLIEHPAIMTHASVPPEVRNELGLTDNLIRISAGIESVDDLIEDLDRALAAV